MGILIRRIPLKGILCTNYILFRVLMNSYEIHSRSVILNKTCEASIYSQSLVFSLPMTYTVVNLMHSVNERGRVNWISYPFSPWELTEVEKIVL